MSGKISSCIGKNTPALSTKYIIGNRFSIAISWARKFFFPVIGNQAPALTVASFATNESPSPKPIPTVRSPVTAERPMLKPPLSALA